LAAPHHFTGLAVLPGFEVLFSTSGKLVVSVKLLLSALAIFGTDVDGDVSNGLVMGQMYAL